MNKNKPLVSVLEDNKWKFKKKEKVFDDILGNQIDMMDEFFKKDSTRKERFESFKNDKERMKESRDNIELVILDNS